MSEEEFKRHKEALAAQKLEKPKRLSTQFGKFLTEISLQQYHFNRAQVEVAFLQTLTKQQIIEYYKVSLYFGYTTDDDRKKIWSRFPVMFRNILSSVANEL